MGNRYVLYSKGLGYYTGKTYSCKKFNEDIAAYPIFTDYMEDAKKYSSIKRVKNFITSFSAKNSNNYEWQIKEVEHE